MFKQEKAPSNMTEALEEIEKLKKVNGYTLEENKKLKKVNEDTKTLLGKRGRNFMKGELEPGQERFMEFSSDMFEPCKKSYS
tara:strand:+ start:1263 stop:1508 length:246 start_codon:yes stop_codon:yes gene_type:complete